MSIILFALVDILNVYNIVTMVFWILQCEYKRKQTLFIHCIQPAGVRQSNNSTFLHYQGQISTEKHIHFS